MEDTKYCPHCGKPVKATAKKCIHCKKWIDSSQRQSGESNNATSGSTSSSKTVGIVLISLLAALILGTLIYMLTSGKDDESEYRSERSEYYDDSRSSDRKIDYDHSSDYTSKVFTRECPTCYGIGEVDGELCAVCHGYGKLMIREGKCKKGCGCAGFMSQIDGDICINCMLTFDCYSTESQHEH